MARLFDSRSDFETYYGSSGEPWGHPSGRRSIRLHYNFGTIGVGQNKHSETMASALGGVADKRIALIGCGFNWTGEGFTNLGATVVGTEVSDYCLTAQHETEEADLREYIARAGLDPDRDKIIGPNGKADLDPLDYWIRGSRAKPEPRTATPLIDEDCGNAASRSRVAQRVNGGLDEIITEEVINSIGDAEALGLCDQLAALSKEKGGRVVHILSPLMPEMFNAGNQSPGLNWKLYSQWRAFLDANGFTDHLVMPSVTTEGKRAYGELF